MKRILTLGIVLLTANSLLPAQEITFSETKFNWGTVREQDGNVSHDFRFVNTGDKPLTIKNIITGCGCTSSEWTEKAYQPGEEGIIRLGFGFAFRWRDYSGWNRKGPHVLSLPPFPG